MIYENFKILNKNPIIPHIHLSVCSLGAITLIGVDMDKVLRPAMSYGNRFTQLTTEAAENAARLVLCQLSERLNFAKQQSKTDEEMECLQFGICSYQPQQQRVIV